MIFLIAFFYSMVNSFFSLIILIATFSIIRVLLTYIVYTNAKRRELDNPVFWGVITLFTGIVSVILFFAFNINLGKKSKPEKKHKVIVASTLAVCVCLVISSAVVGHFKTIEDTVENCNSVVEKIAPYKYVTYDKSGKQYDIMDIYLFDYWDSECKKEGSIDIYDRNGEKLDSEIEIYVNSDGYGISKLDAKNFQKRYYEDEYYTYTVYFDNEHNIYYDDEDCSWDKNGNLIFKEKIFEKLTYENTKPIDEFFNNEEY